MSKNRWCATLALLLAPVLCVGCRSQLGAVYDVKTGKATASDVAPERVAIDQPPVTQASFAPPRVDANTPAPRRTLNVGENPLPEPTRDEAFAAVLDDLQAVGAQSQVAQQELLAQLQQAEPAHWESIARRFRSTVAYQQQLSTGLPTEPADGLRHAGHVNAALSSQPLRRAEPRRQPQADPAPTTPTDTSATGMPSTREYQLAPQSQPAGQSQSAGQSQPAMHSQPMQGQPGYGQPPAPEIPQQSNQPSAMHQPSMPHQTAPTQMMAKPPAMEADSPQSAARGAVRLASVEMEVTSGAGATQPMVVNNPYHDDPVTTSHVGRSSNQSPPPTRRLPITPKTASEAMAEAIALAEAESTADPLSTDEAYQHARLRMLKLAAGDADGAVAPIPGLSPTEQRYWSNQFFALSTMLDSTAQPQSARRAAAAELHLATAQQELEQMASLAVRNLTFCTDVYAFGGYDERPTRRFRPGEEVNLYVEIDNYRSEPSKDGYRTLLGGSYQVLDARGARVDGREFTPVDDYCLSRRRDFHMHFIIGLPERIYAGEYQLELTINDQLGNKIGRAAIDFEIVDDTASESSPRSARAKR